MPIASLTDSEARREALVGIFKLLDTNESGCGVARVAAQRAVTQELLALDGRTGRSQPSARRQASF
jgi:hypothetical protein